MVGACDWPVTTGYQERDILDLALLDLESDLLHVCVLYWGLNPGLANARTFYH